MNPSPEQFKSGKKLRIPKDGSDQLKSAMLVIEKDSQVRNIDFVKVTKL